MLQNLIEKLWFRFSKIPTWQRAMETTPDGTLTSFKMKEILIGPLKWRKGWEKDYNSKTDPSFRPSRAWNPNLSDPKNISPRGGVLTLTQPKEEKAKDAWLQSNFTIKYGTVRALIRLPKVNGAWSAFWLFGENGMPEHDIFEHCGSWENEVAVTHHWGYDYDGKEERSQQSIMEGTIKTSSQQKITICMK